MAKTKNFTGALTGNRKSHLDALISTPVPPVEQPVAKDAPVKQEKSTKEPEEVTGVQDTAAETAARKSGSREKPKKRVGRPPKTETRGRFFLSGSEEVIERLRAAAFWERREYSTFVERAVEYYIEKEIGENDMKRALKMFRERMEE